MASVDVTLLEGEVKNDTAGSYTMIYGAKDVCANVINFVVNVKTVTDEDLKAIKDKIGETILPKI
jgi:hypothetical protein